MQRPSFQFYPADWRSNAKLRRCSPAARGVWMDILCLLHDSDDAYGLLRWPLADIAIAAGARMSLVQELADKEVLKGSDTEMMEPFSYTPRSGRKDGPTVVLLPTQKGPIWYSSRMVTDEYKRHNSGASSRFCSEKPVENTSSRRAPRQRHGDNQGDGSSSSSSSSPSVSKKDDDVRASELLVRICEILRLNLQDDPERLTWLRQADEMIRDGLTRDEIIAATEQARTRGVVKNAMAYIRTVAFALREKPKTERISAHDKGTQAAAELIAEFNARDRARNHPNPGTPRGALPAPGHGQGEVEAIDLELRRHSERKDV